MTTLEFRSHKDDAWYDVVLGKENVNRLSIKFESFPEEAARTVNAANLTSLSAVEELRSRFRRMSIQLQDSDCASVEKGLLVCAAATVKSDDLRFYDAFVHEVVRKEHEFVGGEQVCTCSFVLEWIHGPKDGSLSFIALENICRVQLPGVDEEVDPVLTSFLNAAKERIENRESVASSGGKTRRPRKRYRGSSSSQRVDKDSSLARRCLANCSSKERINNPSEGDRHVDVSIGGVPSVVFVENLKKGISPIAIMQFIHEQISVSCRAFVSPSKLSESYTKGTIIVENRRDFGKLTNFLESPDHIIVSSNRRPWVVTEKRILDHTLRETVEDFNHTSETAFESRPQNSNEFKVVASGTQEYRQAKRLKYLINEFIDHLSTLHDRLLYEEEKILQID